ncbi:MAG: hypothetical protein GXO08_01990 [Aquificae bacterium]|nr:hypothetical protein [Aquificota bacterium]
MGPLTFLKELLKRVFNALVAVYLLYLFFLYAWSTFDYLVPRLSFVLAVLVTAVLTGFLGWYYYPKIIGKE